MACSLVMVVFVTISFGYLLTTVCDAGCPFSQMNFVENSEDDASERQSVPNAVPCEPLISPPPSCDVSTPYRTVDGTCNNLKNPTWGAAGTTLSRLMPNNYADGKGKPFQGVGGSGIPNTRSVSIAVNPDKPTCLDYSVNQFFWFWGEISVGDILDSAAQRTLKCPTNGNPDACISIKIPAEDSFNNQFGVTEFNLARFSPPCYNGVFDGTKERVPVNRQTHFLDCSHVYGTSAATQNSTRSFKDGKLKMDPNFPNLLPVLQRSTGPPLFIIADTRVNMDPQLGLTASISFNLHNRICDLLRGVNPSWDDNRLFQEARRITTAIHQVIIYGEFLPLLVGPDRMRELDLQLPSCRTQFTTYKPDVKVAMFAEVAYAAFRLHTGPQNNLEVFGRSPAPLKNNFITAQLLISEKDMPERLTKGALQQCGSNNDRFFADAITKYGPQPPVNITHGIDVAAIDMRRAEDAGVPSYLGIRKFLGLEVPKDFSGLGKIWNDADGTRLVQQVYKGEVENVHAYLGMLMEPHVPNGVTGTTASNLIGRQFKAYKEGDRFFVTHGAQAGSFTKCQLKAIRSTLLSDVVCLALPGVQQVPQKIFQNLPPFVDCSTVKFDISPWKEQQGRFNDVCTADC